MLKAILLFVLASSGVYYFHNPQTVVPVVNDNQNIHANIIEPEPYRVCIFRNDKEHGTTNISLTNCELNDDKCIDELRLRVDKN